MLYDVEHFKYMQNTYRIQTPSVFVYNRHSDSNEMAGTDFHTSSVTILVHCV